LQDNSFDLTLFIRSIQILEGNPVCFGTAAGSCERLDCAWRDYCLGKMQDHPMRKKKASDEKNRDFI